jgi:hypothetical protein
MNAVSGVATFTNLVMTVTGSKTLSATSPGLTGATSSSFDITPAAATQLAFSTQPVGGTAGAALSTQPVVQVRDASGNVMTTSTDAVTLSVASGTGTLGGTLTVNAVAGIATFTGVTMDLIGVKTMRASAAGLTNATSSSFTITGGLTSASSSVVASPSSVFANGSDTSTVTVTLTDAGGNPLAGKNVTLASSRGATDTITGSPATTDALGVATFTVVSSTVGAPTFTADCTTDSVVLSTTPAVTFQSALADAAQSTWSIHPVTVAADGSSTATVNVTVKNSGGTALAGKSVTLASSRGGSDTITTSPAVTNGSGQASFTVQSSTRGEANLTLAVSTDSVTITNQGRLVFYDVAPYADWQAQLANSSSSKMIPGSNSPSTSTWVDLFNLGPNNGVLNNFSYNTTSGWCGSGTGAITSCADGAYRLVLDGSNDYVNFGTSLGSFSSATYETWIRAANPTLKGKVILSNGDSSSHGLVLRQGWDASSKIEMNIGNTKSYAAEIDSDSPLAYFKLDETAGTTAVAVRGGTNGTYTSTYTLNQGTGINENRSSVNFNGTNGHITMTNVYEGTADQAVEAWVYPTNITGTRPIVSKMSATRGYSLELVSGRASFRLFNAAGTAETVTGTTTLSLNTWYHIVGVRNTVTGKLHIYVNGNEESDAVFTGALGTSTTAFYVGRNNTAYFAGRIDEVAVYNYILSPTRIAAHYAARTVPTCYSSTLLSSSAWRHVAATFDGSSGDLKLYVNGSLECTRAATGATLSGSGVPMAFGAYVDGSGTPQASSYWSGAIGDFRLYNSVLTGGQITNNRNATSGRFP